MKLHLPMIILLFILITACGGETNIIPNTDESKIIIDEERSLITFYALIENDHRRKEGPLYAKFIIYDETLQAAIGYEEVIHFTNEEGEKQPFTIGGNSSYFISESFIYNAELDDQELVNQIEVVISDENEMELVQFLIPSIEKHEAPSS